MKKIPSLFTRDPSNPAILTDVFHGLADWVTAGFGVATWKWDGTACRWADGQTDQDCDKVKITGAALGIPRRRS